MLLYMPPIVARLSVASRAIEFLQPRILLCFASVKTRLPSPICIIIWAFPHSCKGLDCYGVGLSVAMADWYCSRRLPFPLQSLTQLTLARFYSVYINSRTAVSGSSLYFSCINSLRPQFPALS